MAKKSKYYVVWKGRRTGIFTTWSECSAQVTGYAGAQYKSFENRADANKAFQGNYEDYKGQQTITPDEHRVLEVGQPISDSYCVDASCTGNPGRLEYKCVHTTTKELIFQQGPFENGTNNIGEFLAIVHALALFKKHGITLPIYSDSANAILWVHSKKCNTKLAADATNATLFELIDKAELWLNENQYPNQILKWQTDVWGEIPADYGRK